MLCVAGEPKFNELLSDPIIRAVMARDAVAEIDLRRLVEQAWQSYQRRPEPQPQRR